MSHSVDICPLRCLSLHSLGPLHDLITLSWAVSGILITAYRGIAGNFASNAVQRIMTSYEPFGGYLSFAMPFAAFSRSASRSHYTLLGCFRYLDHGISRDRWQLRFKRSTTYYDKL